METKKFKCKDGILLRLKDDESVWFYAVFSHYCENDNYITISGGNTHSLGLYYILPYEGNEHLVGTSDEPEEEVKLGKGEWVMAKTQNNNWVLAKYKSHNELPWNNIDVEFFNGHPVLVDEIIRFSDFNPADMEETKKHILCVKNGKIVRYKN